MILRITEICWGINRRTGERSSKQTDEKILTPVVGEIIEMPTGRRKFTVDAVDENSITVTVYYENNPSAKKTFVIEKEESALYNPMSRDGGYKYTLSYEE